MLHFGGVINTSKNYISLNSNLNVYNDVSFAGYLIVDKDISFNSNSKELISNTEAMNNIPSFDYLLIGYRSGKNDSSVILKKGNKEYVVAKGEKLEGTYELIEVTKDEVIFRNKEKLYRIENRVGNNL